MSNWYGTCRSNYFRVKNREAFETFLGQFEAKLIEQAPDLVGFVSDDEYGSIPSYYPDDDSDPISITEGIAEHLAKGQVCIILEAGAEKARYITGIAVAISWTNERIDIALSDIYAKAQEAFGGDAQITEAIY